jgi:hypothetical protein
MSKQNQPSNDRPPTAEIGSHAKQQQRAESPALDQVEKIVDRAHKEVAWVHEAYMRYAKILGTILAVGIAAATFLTWNSAREMKSDLGRQAIEISDRVNKRIDVEFSKESIQNLVQKKAEERVDIVADRIITNYIDQIFKPKLEAFEAKLNEFDARTASGEKQLDAKISATESRLKTLESEALAELRQTSEYVMVVVDAKNNDLKAYKQLMKWANDKTYRFHERASQAREAILDEHESMWEINYQVRWKTGVDPSKLSLDALKSDFAATKALQQVALIQYVWRRPDFSKKEKMEFLVQVMKLEDGDLRAVEQAGRYFQTESKQGLKPLVTDQMVDWWEKHKDDYPQTQPTDVPNKK